MEDRWEQTDNMSKHLVNFEGGSHWYAKDGQPAHDATLREARKEFLYPSVTTIIKDQIKNEFLDRWKLNQTLKAAGDNMRQPHESPEDYAKRIWEVAMEKATTAADFGGRIHKACDNHPSMPEPELMPWFAQFDAWYQLSVAETIASECVLLDHDLGVAGRTDRKAVLRSGKRAIIDYKTQDVKIDRKGRKTPAFYESFPVQLSFYAVADAKEVGIFPDLPECVSVIIDSNEGGLVYPKTYSREEVIEAYEDFVIAAYGWAKKRNYWATGRKWNITMGIPMPTP